MSSITPGLSSTPQLAVAAEVIRENAPEVHQRSLLESYMQLTKARLSALVLVTTMVGYILASPGTIDWLGLVWTLLGTALAAGCASSFNQVIEINLDRRMLRTQGRPLPSGEMSVAHAISAGCIMGVTGLAMLALMVNVPAAALALATIIIYVLAYTPLKVRSTLNTIVGAVSGAIPPMIGWVAATGSIERGAWLLASILFVWQIPHFLALAWLYRDDYERGGFKMLPVLDRDGRLTTRVVVLTAALLLPLGLMGTLLNISGAIFAAGSLMLGIWMLVLCLRLYFCRSDANARRVFLASIAYLPLLLCLMVIDR